jgi:hypothetical protein
MNRISYTNTPWRGKTTPVFCERIGLLVSNAPPGFHGRNPHWFCFFDAD